jgi:protein phosphatase
MNQDPAAFLPESEEYLELILRQTRSRVRVLRIRQLIALVLGILVVAGGLFAAYSFTQSRYYIGESSSGKVAIFRGIHESFGSIRFSELYQETSTEVKTLTLLQQDQVHRTISADNLNDARLKFKVLLSIEGK